MTRNGLLISHDERLTTLTAAYPTHPGGNALSSSSKIFCAR